MTERDVWAAGAAYEAYVGRWSRDVAARFVRWLAAPPGLRWLDVGCGTGALTAHVLSAAEPAHVVGVDPSMGFLSSARAAAPRASFLRAGAESLPLLARSVHVVVSGLALNFVPDPARALAEFTRVTPPGGVIAAYVWDYGDGMAMIRTFWDTATALDPTAATHHEGHRFPLCRPDPLTHLWTAAGLDQVTVHPIEIPTTFTDFDDYWTPFLGGQGPAPTYIQSLPADHRHTLRETLRANLPTTADGRIHLTARAWAIRGVRAEA
ncbi:class I SAM-dependent methyltransferase [Actinokineospora inagensis]|uniref:class I SAM-dependent methyltransferase n=1 Tax=Actinokineospora inagensis TaxID=103730 RepID=UPI0004026FC9|nr:methyltransferase domain-containing protein [Actinokineospora inagensis]